MLSGKNILVCITGGIAAYKTCELIRMYKRANANVRVICTPNALNFVTKLTLQNLSQNEVGIEEFDVKDFKPEHISYADEADIMVICPATANTISKIANGMCDNLLTSVAAAFSKPVIFAPAMNTNMLNNVFIKENINKLHKNPDYYIVEPESGFLACGTEGKGRLAALDKIFDKTVEVLKLTSDVQEKFLSGKKVIVTAGGTIEDIDPVRYISNYSSGKMGLALANACYNSGAQVVLITTKDFDCPYRVIKVKSAIDMLKVVENEFVDTDYIFMAAAVADYRVKDISKQKIKKTADDEITLKLVKNPDILKEISSRKKHQTVVGFCAESENLIENAKEKIKRKGCDFLIANDISRKDIGFSSDYNEVYIINKDLDVTKISRQEKSLLATRIIEEINAQTRRVQAN